jgi:hypothetical protein
VEVVIDEKLHQFLGYGDMKIVSNTDVSEKLVAFVFRIETEIAPAVYLLA